MGNWDVAASLATAGGTLVLAGATFVAVRSANQSARVTERALLAGIRPVLVTSRFEDPPEKVGFADNHWVRVPGGRGIVEVTDDAVYLAIALKNVGRGLAVLDSWDLRPLGDQPDPTHHGPQDFRRLTRDIYVPAGDLGFWQGTVRDTTDPLFAVIRDCAEKRVALLVDMLYRDHEGGQRTISRFALRPDDGGGGWVTSVSRHWNLDRGDPR
ncbi:MAG: hypothetical protein ACRDY1_07530 [Acidimicrobiales bacterium]